jgi:hypothetical protein
MDIVGLIIGFLSGLVLGYLGHIYQIRLGKVNVRRERLLSNIAKVEKYISILLEFEYIEYKILQLKNKVIKPQQILEETQVWIIKELKRIHKEQDEKRKEKEQKINDIKENINRLLSNSGRYSGELDKLTHMSNSGKYSSELDKYTRELDEAEKELDTYNKQSYNDIDIIPKVAEKFQVSDIASYRQDEEHVRIELTVNTKLSNEDKEDIETLSKELDNLNKEIIVSDIANTCLIVDQSGELLRYLNELMAARHKDLKNLNERDQGNRQSELRYKIRKLLDNKIN